MLGIGGRFAGAKGMVAMPNLADLTPEQALTALQTAGLRRGAQTSSETGTQSLNNKTFSQSIAAGTLVDYETSIDYSFYVFVAPPAPPEQPPAPASPVLCGEFYSAVIDTGFDCLDGGFSRPWTLTENRRNFCLNGVPTGSYITDGLSAQKRLGDLSEQIIRPTSVTGCPAPVANGTMPSVLGLTESEAVQRINQAGFPTVVVGSQLGFVANAVLGRVTEQDPAAQSVIPRDTTIYIIIYQHVPPVTTEPDPPLPTLYWYSGCCFNSQISAFSSVSFEQALNLMNTECTTGITSQQSGTGGALPSINCAPPVVVECFDDEVSSWEGDCINSLRQTAVRYKNSCTGVERVVSSSEFCCESVAIEISSWRSTVCRGGLRATAVRYEDSCTGEQYVVPGTVRC